MKRLRNLKSFQIIKSEIEKLKTYSGLCPFEGLSNGTTLIQSGRPVPLIANLPAPYPPPPPPSQASPTTALLVS
jgi:hypothetical protein